MIGRAYMQVDVSADRRGQGLVDSSDHAGSFSVNLKSSDDVDLRLHEVVHQIGSQQSTAKRFQ